ncbi:hypothetical protein J0A68_22390, partial [Algoriphagus sp. H41]
ARSFLPFLRALSGKIFLLDFFTTESGRNRRGLVLIYPVIRCADARETASFPNFLQLSGSARKALSRRLQGAKLSPFTLRALQ